MRRGFARACRVDRATRRTEDERHGRLQCMRMCMCCTSPLHESCMCPAVFSSCSCAPYGYWLALLWLQACIATVTGLYCYGCRPGLLRLPACTAMVAGQHCYGCRRPLLWLQACSSSSRILCGSTGKKPPCHSEYSHSEYGHIRVVRTLRKPAYSTVWR